MSIKNMFYGKLHIKKNHPKEFGITKDILDLLIKKEKTVSKISTKTALENGTDKNFSKNTK